MVFDPASIALSIGTSIAKKAILGGGKSAQPRMSVPQLKQFSALTNFSSRSAPAVATSARTNFQVQMATLKSGQAFSSKIQRKLAERGLG
tara:strand:- start:3471 stop:3740 length:270 start_codon:yes stop_codon:yes gene_type:complete